MSPRQEVIHYVGEGKLELALRTCPCYLSDEARDWIVQHVKSALKRPLTDRLARAVRQSEEQTQRGRISKALTRGELSRASRSAHL